MDLFLREGMNFSGSSVPYIDDWFERFEIYDSRGRRAVESQIGDDPAANLQLTGRGLTWVVYHSRDNFVDMQPAKFKSYLQEEGLEAVLPRWHARGLAGQQVREWYQRNVKALLWSGGEDETRLREPQGLPLEIIPQHNPYTLKPGQPLAVQLRFQGQPQAALLVVAFRQSAPEQQLRVRTDVDGMAELSLNAPGRWLVKAVHMVEVSDGKADWRSYWASLTFDTR